MRCREDRRLPPGSCVGSFIVSLGPLLVIFIVAAAATWVAGGFLSQATDVLDDRFGLGDAVGGLLLLGLAGSLPELAITASAALSGDLPLATGNLLGGIAIQTLVLVLLDATSRRGKPLSSLTADVSPLLEAGMVVVLVALAIMGGLLPESTSIGPMSPMSIAIVAFFLIGIVGINRSRQRPGWTFAGETPPATEKSPNRFESSSTRAVLAVFGLASLVTLGAGVALEQTGNDIAGHLGMNGVVFGATILAAVTALPEVSSGIQAVRLGAIGLAMSDIYGGNAVQLTFFLLADLLAGDPVLPQASAESLWLGGLGALVTGIMIYGLIMRPPRKILGVGPDSLLVLLTYIAGVVLLTKVPG
jgi:cation:H+ antiporter